MRNFSDLLHRANLNCMEMFLMNGSECCDAPSGGTYAERLKEADKKALAFFQERYSDISEFDEITEYFYAQIASYEDVFFEIGLLVGAKIGFQAREKMEELS